MRQIGIYQGRLSPAERSAAQFFPTRWEEEFPIAKKMGFASITWFLDCDIPGFDPIRDIWGRPDVLGKIDRARAIIPIQAIDCSQNYLLFGPQAQATLAAFEILLPALASRTNGTVILPLLLGNAPHTPAEKKELSGTLRQLLRAAEPLGLRLALETEMPAEELRVFVDSFDTSMLGVCYDTGNATAYGFDCPAEIRQLGHRIFEVHLKDHKRGHTIGVDPSVALGSGDTDFDGCIAALNEIQYAGGLTMQAWRGAHYLEDAASQFAFITKKLDALSYGN